MVEKEYEGDDPMEFVAHRFPVPPGVDIDAEMARCFIEEFALMGMPKDRVFHIFSSRFFAGTHAVLEARGEALIRGLIDGVYGPARAQEVQ